MNTARVVVACVSNEYIRSENCKLEFRFAHASLKLPIVKAVVGRGDDWRNHEIAFLGGAYPEVNFQYENSSAYQDLLEHVKSALEKSKARQQQQQQQTAAAADRSENIDAQKNVDNTNTAYQELYELTQRKFLKQLVQISDKMYTSRPCPRLFCIDFIESTKIQVIS